MTSLSTRCCITGGGPAGLVLGYLLARAGVGVVVLEKHADFLRDFRGDTIHPSTLQLMADLGLLEDFLRLPHDRFRTMTADFEGHSVRVADFSTLKVAAPFVAMMPQWDFLDWLADHGRALKGFRLLMSTEAQGLIEEGGRVAGVRAEGPEGPLEVRAPLVVACDGRHSTLRAAAGLPVEDLGAPIDVLWFRLSRRPDDPPEALGRFRGGRIFVMLNRGDYWQCAHVVAKGGADAVRAQGIAAFRALLDASLGLPGRAAEIGTWEQVKLLSVAVNRMPVWWRAGLLCIGDAAHAMSPIGGIGVNVAVQDAIAAANLLWRPLSGGTVSTADLAAVQARRLPAVRLLQRLQVAAQDRVIRPMIDGGAASRMPLAFRLIDRFPWLRRLPSRMIGQGPWMERVSDDIVRAPPAA
jgi:2-polyprenyl-6-methoxyphenol hydroxylase-like FAD-dependent oxidoreductase